MCNTCGCVVSHEHPIHKDNQTTETLNLLTHLLSDNNHQALHNREHFDQHGILVLNLMSSPGAGKTALLETTIDVLKKEFSIAVIEGDLETENDAERIRRKGVPALQIMTGSACHLDAHLIHQALHHLDLTSLDLLFIENVGNLVCPASFDLGHHRNVVLLSTTEGDDKPAKYPVMFRTADLMLITKIDLLPVLEDFDLQKAQRHLRQLANLAPVIPISAKKHQGVETWVAWLRQQVITQKERLQQAQTSLPLSNPPHFHPYPPTLCTPSEPLINL